MRSRADATRAVLDVAERTVAQGETGLQLCAVVDGEVVVDVSVGWTAPSAQTPVGPSSLFPVFSATKGVVTVAALELVAAGDGGLTMDGSVARLWPELGGRGITVRHLLTHTAGLPQMPAGTTVRRMCDWTAMVAALQQQTPLWAPGARVGYHAYTFGWLLGELLRRAAALPGEDAGALVRRVACLPAGADDFWVGLPDTEHDRVAELRLDGRRPVAPGSLFRRAIPAHLDTGPRVYGRAEVRRAALLGAGGIGSARSLALVYARAAALSAAGPAAGPAGALLRAATNLCEVRQDLVLGIHVPRGLGFYVSGSRAHPLGPPFDGAPGVFGHPGAGGSVAWGDRRLRAGFAVCRSRMTATGWNDPVVRSLCGALTAAVAG